MIGGAGVRGRGGVAAARVCCGGAQSSSDSSTASHRSAVTPREKAVKFSECMRANGVSDFPYPNASGEFPSYGVSVSPAVEGGELLWSMGVDL